MSANGPVRAITNARIYVSPDEPPIDRGTVLVRDGRIARVGADVPVPEGAQVLDSDHGTVTAGFWNAHVHFTEPKWAPIGGKRPEELERQLAEMLTRRGFTTVVDTGSDPRVTFRLRDRVAAGELVGPAIYTAGTGLYPPNGIPYYVRDSLPFYLRWWIPQPSTPDAAVRTVERHYRRGGDLVKLFTGSYVERGRVLPMPLAVARAAVEAAHSHRQLVYAHPSDLAGTRVALESGVDVLAHAPDSTDGIDEALLRRIVERPIAMIPTLKMFDTTVTRNPSYLQPIYDLVRQFHRLGGRLLFGTDVGYMTDYSTEGEFTALQRCGLDSSEILRMLTTAPAERFGVSQNAGTVTEGKVADLVVMDGDPAADILAFSRVRRTIRGGRTIWSGS